MSKHSKSYPGVQTGRARISSSRALCWLEYNANISLSCQGWANTVSLALEFRLVEQEYLPREHCVYYNIDNANAGLSCQGWASRVSLVQEVRLAVWHVVLYHSSWLSVVWLSEQLFLLVHLKLHVRHLELFSDLDFLFFIRPFHYSFRNTSNLLKWINHLDCMVHYSVCCVWHHIALTSRLIFFSRYSLSARRTWESPSTFVVSNSLL